MNKFLKAGFLGLALVLQTACSSSDNTSDNDPAPVNPGEPLTNEVDFWLTRGDESVKLAKQNVVLGFGTVQNANPFVDVDDTQTYQSIDGFGYTLTGGSAQVINQMSPARKQELLQDLFSANGIAVSYLRLSIGASDLHATPFTYNDMPVGQTDENLANFSIAQDQAGVIELLKEILLINPAIKIVATPWTAPTWMKDNNSFIGGSLLPQYYAAYAQYFVKYIQAMQQQGISITAITPQNEPLNPHNNPSMVMTGSEQNNFIKNNLGPAFAAAGITTKIIIYDHNCDNIQYAMGILGDAATNPYVDGTAFHLYAGDINIMSSLHNAFPTKNLYFTEQYTAGNGNFGGDLKWHFKNVLIGSTRNWSKNVLEWNLASDSNYDPHTPGGCSDCKGAITVIGSSTFQKNVAYYIIAHASKFVPPGSVRIASNNIGVINTVAFKTPQGKIVLIAENDGNTPISFNIRHNGKWVTPNLAGGAVATFVW